MSHNDNQSKNSMTGTFISKIFYNMPLKNVKENLPFALLGNTFHFLFWLKKLYGGGGGVVIRWSFLPNKPEFIEAHFWEKTNMHIFLTGKLTWVFCNSRSNLCKSEADIPVFIITGSECTKQVTFVLS